MILWSAHTGGFGGILDGSKDGITDVAVREEAAVAPLPLATDPSRWSLTLPRVAQWHPRRAYVACCRRKNAVELWSKTFAEEWTAFAPNVKQLDRNVEYVEKEDEFDAVRHARTVHCARHRVGCRSPVWLIE